MIESNYYTLKFNKPGRTETQKRRDALQNALEQLTQYQVKASKKKLPIVKKLIAAYSDLLDQIKYKLGE